MNKDSGFRNNVPLSKAAREIDGLRHIDVDLVQWCKDCLQPELLIESTSAHKKNTQITRIIAAGCGAPTMLLRHAYDDQNHEDPVDIYIWQPGNVGYRDKPDRTLEAVTWKKLQEVLRWFHTTHECESK